MNIKMLIYNIFFSNADFNKIYFDWQDVLGCTTEIDFFLWPRNDIEKIECTLFSRWKGDDAPFKPIQVICIFKLMIWFESFNYRYILMKTIFMVHCAYNNSTKLLIFMEYKNRRCGIIINEIIHQMPSNEQSNFYRSFLFQKSHNITLVVW